MIKRTFAELVTDLRMRRTNGERPPVLLIGAGASVDAGIGAMDELFKFFSCKDFEDFCAYIEPTTPAERYRYLSQFLQTQKPAEVTPGYQALATLCAQNYFDLVLTTNMDPLLDDALAAARLWRSDYALLINGIIRYDRLALLLRSQRPRVKVVKLHGDLFQPFMAWTVAEMDSFLSEISPSLSPVVAGRDFLVVGYSLRDRRVRELVESSGGAVWFTHPKAVPGHLGTNTTYRAVVDPECGFERFFPALAKSLQVDLDATATAVPGDGGAKRSRQPKRSSEQRVPSAQTLDDLMAATFSLLGEDGKPVSTAFLLADPRVIICDRFCFEHSARGDVIDLDVHGERLSVRRIRSATKHPFGPVVLEAPATLHMPGLRLDGSTIQLGQTVQVAVATGVKTGISTGKAVTAVEMSLRIMPLQEMVPNLMELECATAGGSSGAPVVDGKLAVRGFIVAGSTSPDDPRSFAYAAEHWAKLVRAKRVAP